ncbi:MAG: beta-lactamase family protein [Ignavibacteria bacterium]|nr:beta-lactamase family protein [Ignavibacteria bacterium]
MVVSDSKIIYRKMAGSSDLERLVPVRDNTIFNIGSLSKQFTAFLILLLEEENKLSIEDDVSKYLPEYQIFKTNGIKIKHLLYHTSGLREQITMLQLCGWKDDDVYSAADEKYLLSRQGDVNFTPGTMMQYSNTNYFALGLIIEKVTGKKFSDYCDEQIFIPLDMKTAQVADDHSQLILNKAEAYNTIKEDEVRKYSPSDDDYGHSSIYCSADDLKKWADNFSEKKIGSDVLYQKFFSKGSYDNGKPILSYGYGWFHDSYKGIPDIWHDGARLGFRSGLLYFPEKNVYIITLSNARDFPYADLREKIADHIFTGQFPAEKTDESKPIAPYMQSIRQKRT